MKAAIVSALAVALFVGPAFAQVSFTGPLVASTSQKGSALIFPLITIDPTSASDTVVEISNDQSLTVQVECYYVNEKKGRVDFSFSLSGNGTVTWDVGTGFGDHVNAAAFPTTGAFAGFEVPTSIYRGELICFATDATGANQVAFNHLYGTATVLRLAQPTAHQPKQAFKYNAWSFKAWNANGTIPGDNMVLSGPKLETPGVIPLTGTIGAIPFYDACPLFNNATFMPDLTPPSTLSYFTLVNYLVGVSCNQDLREAFLLHFTKLEFVVWNSNEDDFTGSFACVDSVFTLGLGAVAAHGLVNSSSFSFPVLQTFDARFQVQGIKNSVCPGSIASGLLTVLNSEVGIADHTISDQNVGNTLYGAGAESGFILWDPIQGEGGFGPGKR